MYAFDGFLIFRVDLHLALTSLFFIFFLRFFVVVFLFFIKVVAAIHA